jgi:cytochrome c biogenesis protein CcmG/thiol:disulfide interchange protein DsbE
VSERAQPAAPRRRIRPAFVIPLIAFLALAAVFLLRLYTEGDISAVPSALIGKPAPEFSLPALADLTADGKPVPGIARADLDGRVTLVNVFASWCAPCRAEHPLLMELAKDPRIRVVAINYKDQPENARRFLGRLGNPFAAIGSDPGGRAAIDWGVYGVPETFLVDAAGTIRLKHTGPLTPDIVRERLRPEIEKALTPG